MPDHEEVTVPLSPIAEAARDLDEGKMVILIDDEDRENEGDLTLAADRVTAEAINGSEYYGKWTRSLRH